MLQLRMVSQTAIYVFWIKVDSDNGIGPFFGLSLINYGRSALPNCRFYCNTLEMTLLQIYSPA